MRALSSSTLADQQCSISASQVNWTSWKYIDFDTLWLYNHEWRTHLVDILKKHVKEIVSNMSKRKTKKPKTHKIQLKAFV